MKITHKFLTDVQAAGWNILQADQDSVVVGCRSAGCCMKAKLRQGVAIPVVAARDHADLIAVENYDEIRAALRSRRHALGLSIADAEDMIGMAKDHLSKMERGNFAKEPSVRLLIDWLHGMGFDLVLRPKPLPPVVLREIVETRSKQGARRARQEPRPDDAPAKLG